jgi:predicted Fe-Mo cluster-binding NifX family protein
MKIAVAASDNHIKSRVDPHFGRCMWFCIYNMETKESEFIENTARHHLKDAGCEAASLLITIGVDIAIAGRFGSKVVEIFRTNKIQMILPEKEKTLHDILNQIK